MNKNALEAPRWKGGPPICSARNLPAFASRKSAMKEAERSFPGVAIAKEVRCSACGGIHLEVKL